MDRQRLLDARESHRTRGDLIVRFGATVGCARSHSNTVHHATNAVYNAPVQVGMTPGAVLRPLPGIEKELAALVRPDSPKTLRDHEALISRLKATQALAAS